MALLLFPFYRWESEREETEKVDKVLARYLARATPEYVIFIISIGIFIIVTEVVAR